MKLILPTLFGVFGLSTAAETTILSLFPSKGVVSAPIIDRERFNGDTVDLEFDGRLHDPCDYISGTKFDLLRGNGKHNGYIVINDCEIMTCTKWISKTDPKRHGGLNTRYSVLPPEDLNSDSWFTAIIAAELTDGECQYYGKFAVGEVCDQDFEPAGLSDCSDSEAGGAGGGAVGGGGVIGGVPGTGGQGSSNGSGGSGQGAAGGGSSGQGTGNGGDVTEGGGDSAQGGGSQGAAGGGGESSGQGTDNSSGEGSSQEGGSSGGEDGTSGDDNEVVGAVARSTSKRPVRDWFRSLSPGVIFFVIVGILLGACCLCSYCIWCFLICCRCVSDEDSLTDLEEDAELGLNGNRESAQVSRRATSNGRSWFARRHENKKSVEPSGGDRGGKALAAGAVAGAAAVGAAGAFRRNANDSSKSAQRTGVQPVDEGSLVESNEEPEGYSQGNSEQDNGRFGGQHGQGRATVMGGTAAAVVGASKSKTKQSSNGKSQRDSKKSTNKNWNPCGNGHASFSDSEIQGDSGDSANQSRDGRNRADKPAAVGAVVAGTGAVAAAAYASSNSKRRNGGSRAGGSRRETDSAVEAGAGNGNKDGTRRTGEGKSGATTAAIVGGAATAAGAAAIIKNKSSSRAVQEPQKTSTSASDRDDATPTGGSHGTQQLSKEALNGNNDGGHGTLGKTAMLGGAAAAVGAAAVVGSSRRSNKLSTEIREPDAKESMGGGGWEICGGYDHRGRSVDKKDTESTWTASRKHASRRNYASDLDDDMYGELVSIEVQQVDSEELQQIKKETKKSKSGRFFLRKKDEPAEERDDTTYQESHQERKTNVSNKGISYEYEQSSSRKIRKKSSSSRRELGDRIGVADPELECGCCAYD